MKTKKGKWLVALVVVAMLFAMVPAMAGADPVDECGKKVVDLIAGQNMVVGTVTVENDDEKVCVTYALDQHTLNDGWRIYETHLAIAPAGEEEHPYNVFQPLRWVNRTGNPSPGQFPYGDDELNGVEEWTYCVSLEELGTENSKELFVAAHAVVKRVVEEAYCETLVEAGDDFFVSDTNTMVVESGNFATPFAAKLAWVHSNWNTNLTRSFNESAQWIWESNRVVNPILGDVLKFEKEFEVPGPPLNGTLYIAADNGFAVYLNGVFLKASPTLPLYPELGDLTETYVNRAGWNNVQEINLDDELLQCENTLTIVAANEYMGPLDGQSNGTVDSNPGGVIFEFDVAWDEVVECYPDVWQSETAWGAGYRFVERGNWATYFNYTLEKVLVDTVEVFSTGNDATEEPDSYSSTIELETDKNYKLVASGTYRFANWGEYGIADAAWNYRRSLNAPNNNAGWYQQESQFLQVWVDAAPVAWQPNEFNPEHIYTYDLVGDGNKLNFTIPDSHYSDNSGSITVKIYWIP